MRVAFVHELGERIGHQAPLVLQISARNGIALWMRSQPTFAMPQKLFDFVITNPVVLVVIQNRDENVEMTKELMQGQSRFHFDAAVGTLTPIWKMFIERQTLGPDKIAERFEELPQKFLTASAGQGRELHTKRQRTITQSRAVFAFGAGQRAAEH